MIVGIGELLWDVYPDGRKVAGGAPFNFAFHCHQLGHPAAIVSRVGDDELGRELRAEVRQLGLSDEFIQTDPKRPTGTVRVTLHAAGVPTYTIAEDVAWDHIEWTSSLSDAAKRAKAVCFGTLAQRNEVSRGTIREFVRAAFDALVVYDANFRPTVDQPDVLFYESVGQCQWLKLNSEELWRLFDNINICEPPRDSLVRVVFDTGMDQRRLAILTLGERGCDITDWQRTDRERAVSANVVDTVGAGDAFTAAMVCTHLEGRPRRECVRFALHYAARVCEHHGATPVIDRDEIEVALLDDPWMRGR